MSENGDAQRRGSLWRIGEAVRNRLPVDVKYARFLVTGYPLFLIGSLEISQPLVRMLIMTRTLSLKELGFASILMATIGFLEVATDIAIARFIYSTPKEEFEEALASAHALSVTRGFVVALIALCVAPMVAASLSLGADWLSFALLAPVILLRSFEHLSYRVAERDFRYGVQLKTLISWYTVSLVVLAVVGVATHSHIALIVSLYAQVLTLIVVSRLVADEPYRMDFRSPLFMKAFKFAYPLVVNGFGLAVSQWADRFIVAALFNLQTVALYSIALLATTVPISLISRVVGTTFLAKFYHAAKSGIGLDRQVRLASRLVAVVSALYGGAVVLMANPAIGLVFGPKFEISAIAMGALGLSAYVKILRSDPYTGVMLNSGRTKKLALSNMLVSTGLVYMALASIVARSFEALLIARLMGEVTSLAATFYLARKVPESGRLIFSWASVAAFGFVVVACAESALLWRSGDSLVDRLAGFGFYAAAVAVWAALLLRRGASRGEALSAGASI